jgi:hypothetical protein
MKTAFTFGIPEIDHLAGHQIKGKTFLLLAGNDDEGMRSFLAEMEKSQGRHAKNEPDCWQFVQADLKKQNLFDIIANSFETNQINPADETNKNVQFDRFPRIDPTAQIDPSHQIDQNENQNLICLIENLSDFSNIEEIEELVNLLRNAVLFLKNTKQKREIILVASLYEGIWPPSIENQIKHLADSYFQFEMTKKYTDFERTLSIWKYKESNISGKILRYVLQDGRIQIENKKRIY